MLARFIYAERFGFYLKVIKEGIIKPDTSFELVKSVNSQKVSEAVKAFTERSSNKALLEQSINNPFLAEQAKDYLGRFI
jgi:MOSC domain-containing protein YiiM